MAVWRRIGRADGLAANGLRRYRGLAHRLVLCVAGFAWDRRDGSFERFGDVARSMRELSPSG